MMLLQVARGRLYSQSSSLINRRCGGAAVSYSLAQPRSTPQPRTTPQPQPPSLLMEGFHLMGKLHYIIYYRELYNPLFLDGAAKALKALHLEDWRETIFSSPFSHAYAVGAPNNEDEGCFSIIRYFRNHLAHNKCEESREGAYESFLMAFGDIAAGFKKILLRMVQRDMRLSWREKRAIRRYLDLSTQVFQDEEVAGFLVEKFLIRRALKMDRLSSGEQAKVCQQLKIGRLPIEKVKKTRTT